MVAAEDVIMVEEKRLRGFLFRKPRSSIVVSHGSSSYTGQMEKRRGKIRKREEKKRGGTKEMVGYISVGCPKL